MKILLSAFLCFAASAMRAQTPESVIQEYANAMGGLDAINKIESAKVTGTLGSQGQKFPITIYIVNGKSMRTDVNVNGQVVTNAFDKGKGWKLNPYENITTATEVTAADDLAILKVQANMANNLMDYKKRGHQVELMGQELVNGVKTNKIKLTSKDDGKTTIYYISTVDQMLVRSDAKQKIQGNEYDAQTFYSNFKVINGLKFSTHFLRKIEGNVFQEVTYDTIELNVAVDEKMFKIPN